MKGRANIRSTDITLFTGTLEGGGAERLQLTLARYFITEGFNVDLLVCKNVGVLKDEVPKEARLVSLDTSRIMLSLPSYLRYLQAARPKVVLASVKKPTIISCLAKIFSRAEHRLLVRVDNIPFPPLPLYRQPAILLWLALMNLTYPFADGVISISKGIRKQLRYFPLLPQGRVTNIYNPAIPDDCQAKLHERPELFEKHRIEHPVILAAGRLHPQKAYPVLLRAFADILKKRHANLAILGEGQRLDELRKLAIALNVTEEVHFLGFAKNPFAYMKAADVFALSSAYEGFGNVVAEALASGTPVVSTDCVSGPREILADGKFGKLVPVGDHKALAQAILETLERGRPPMTEDLREHLDQFRVQEVGRRYRDLAFSPP